MDRQNVFEWLRLVNCIGCGNSRIWSVMADFEDISEANIALTDKSQRHSSTFSTSEIAMAERTSSQQIDELISYCESHNIYILTYDDKHYPERLKTIYNPPAVLFCRGDLSCLDNDFSISIVGTRKPSEYSVKVTSALVKELCTFGMTIVSGFAVGIDITANLAAVRNCGKTIAVLGCGLDHEYPKQNICYREEIEANGLFISEYYPKSGGTHFSFPARNRILSGLSLGTVVIEASVKSGALITANLALSQGKDIFALAPHNLFDRRYGGNVELIRDGAVCLCGVRDIVYEYYENYGHKIANAQELLMAELPEERSGKGHRETMNIVSYAESKEQKEKSPSEKISEPEVREKYDSSMLEGEEAKVYNILKTAGKPILADELAAECEMDISDMLMLLTDLEIDGAISSAAGQSYTAN